MEDRTIDTFGEEQRKIAAKRYGEAFEKATSKQEALKERTRARLNELENDPAADPKDIKTARDVQEFLRFEQDFHRITQSTWYNNFTFMGYSLKWCDYSKMYREVLEEADRRYIYVDPEWAINNLS